MSDVHLEFGPYDPPDVDADVVVLAGDIHVGVRGVQWAREAFPDTPVVYVAGNHEYYKRALPRLTDKLRAAAEDCHVHVLEQDSLQVGDVTFHGATLWTDLELIGGYSLGSATAQTRMTDYGVIRVSPAYRRLRPADTRKLHWSARRWLEEQLAEGNDGPQVVVTHHAPSARSLDPRFGEDPLQAAYASDLEELIADREPALWIHGHIHTPSDYRCGATRVVCNPRGYTDELVAGFDPELVVEV